MSNTTLKNIYLFDVDGTLTPAQQKMTDDFCSFFRGWIKNKKVYLVSGSDYDKLKEQVPEDILTSVEGVFSCMGSILYIGGNKSYSNTFNPPAELLSFLEETLKSTKYWPRCGNHIEKRIGMINFSIVGRKASKQQREEYCVWDDKTSTRIIIASKINKRFKDIEATIGGEISIDIYPAGWDKSQILKYIPIGAYHFFGDKTQPGGNDYALAKKLDKKKDFVYSISSYIDTEKILRTL